MPRSDGGQRVDGFEAISLIRKMEAQHNKQPVKILLISADPDLNEEKVRQNGANYFLAKPFNMAILINKLNEIFHK